MKPITIHPGSALAGAAIVLLVSVLTAQQVVSRLVHVRIVDPIVAAPSPHPRDFVRVEEGTPFTVSLDRILVGTGLRHVSVVALNTIGNPELRAITVQFNGQDVLTVHTKWHLWSSQTASGDGGERDIPPGPGGPEGTVVSVQGGVLLGYLADA